VYVRVYAHTHCDTLHVGFSDHGEPRGWNKTLGGPEDSRWTKFWHMCIVYVYKVLKCKHILIIKAIISGLYKNRQQPELGSREEAFVNYKKR